MKGNNFKTVLLLALPASGKSEVRNFMANMDPEKLRNDFHIGENLQLDDFPYVHFMRRVDEELEKLGEERVFYPSKDLPFFDNRDWGTLTLLLNEDYHALKNQEVIDPESYSMHLFQRIDMAGSKVGLPLRIATLDDDLIEQVAEALEEESKAIVKEIEDQYTDEFDDRTLIIECARGGPDGSEMPLTEGYGYQYTLPLLSDEILDDAAILYIWVTPEESRRKNDERANPNEPGSNLFHGVPIGVMLGDYGCDDMAYLIEHTEVPRTITVEKDNAETGGRKWHIPIGIFDNRIDKTSFLRRNKDSWSYEEIESMTQSIRTATDTMWANYKK